MGRLVLPEWVARNERRRQVLEVDEKSGFAQTRYWNPLLGEIDARLRLVWVGRVDGEEVGVVPYRWHIVRKADDAPDTFWAVTTEGLGSSGGFREMGSDVLETLRSGDLWNESVVYDRRAAERRLQASKERALVTRKEARVGDLALNIKALDNPGVSLAAKGATAKARWKVDTP